MLAVRPAAQAIAIEPSARYISCLRHNLNGAGFPHAEIIPVALGRRPGEIWLYNNTTSASVVNVHYCGFQTVGKQLVKMRTLDDVMQHRGRASLIKVDTDGNDMEVLRGAGTVLRNDRPIVYFELEPRLLHQAPDVDLAWLQSLGYRRFACLDAAGQYVGITDDPGKAIMWACAPSSKGYCDVVCCAVGTGTGRLPARAGQALGRRKADGLKAAFQKFCSNTTCTAYPRRCWPAPIKCWRRRCAGN